MKKNTIVNSAPVDDVNLLPFFSGKIGEIIMGLFLEDQVEILSSGLADLVGALHKTSFALMLRLQGEKHSYKIAMKKIDKDTTDEDKLVILQSLQGLSRLPAPDESGEDVSVIVVFLEEPFDENHTPICKVINGEDNQDFFIILVYLDKNVEGKIGDLVHDLNECNPDLMRLGWIKDKMKWIYSNECQKSSKSYWDLINLSWKNKMSVELHDLGYKKEEIKGILNLNEEEAKGIFFVIDEVDRISKKNKKE